MIATKARLFAAVSMVTLSVLAGSGALAQELVIDATRQPGEVRTGHLRMGASTSPGGVTLGVNSQYLTRDGEPWLPVMGELHYTRFPPDQWDQELAKMKAQGIDVVAAYIIWNHHEERAGDFNWSEDRDLRRFVETAARHGLYVVVRLGPWYHGEVRYGGTPDWIVNAMPSRRNDPTYLGYVDRYWRQVYAQIEGLLWKDGGPIIGVQLENEYNLQGPGMGAEHITALKTMAQDIGFDVPLYTVTGWDGAIYPRGEVLPVFAGYPDEPWGTTVDRLPPKEVYAFRFDSRVAGNVGAQTTAHGPGTIETDMADTPFLGAEYGGGVPIMYRRRPLIMPDDIAAMLPVQLGSGANLYGYYMFHGGRNPAGHTTLEEDDRLGAYNGLPILNYDFQAPIGQYGQIHPVADAIRPYHLFIHAFGSRLVTMAVQRPPVEPTTRDDVTTPRWSVRSEGERGFLFFNNHVRQYEPPVQADTRFTVTLPSGPVTFPSTPIDIPSGAHFIWPINMDLDGVTLNWATAQPVTRIEDEAGPLYVFAAANGIPVEFAIQGEGVQVRAGSRRLSAGADGRVLASGLRPGTGEALRIETADGKTVRIVVLTHDQAEDAYVLPLGGRDRLVLSADPVFAGETGLTVRSRDDAAFRVSVFPDLDAAPAGSLSVRRGREDGVFQTWEAQAVARDLSVSIAPLREAGQMPPPEFGGSANVGIQPYPETYGRSAAWTLTLPADALEGLSDAFLRIDYTGDVARLFDEVELLDDQFFYGPEWEIGLKRFADRLDGPWTLTVLPLRADSPVYIQEEVRPDIPEGGQVAELTGARIVPEYELILTVRP
ncbi:beta-galactosidase [Brevundimonas sp.]|uniref:beta-galactosidase n=1 Tax=Brevundimonas sp. TaxID=1871086 RepID=UPI002ABC7DD1|nr:beta-galactosidase [Brevundimonas sp.]MDZ4362849.1 beta-galactosidase [Brevundimonas sp.]